MVISYPFPNALVKYIHPSAVQAQLNNPSQERTIKVESCLTTETIEGTSLALESVDYVEGGDSLALGVLSVGDGVADDTLEEGLENTTGLLVDHSRNTLDTATTSETSDSGLGDSLNVVSQNLSVTLGTALAEALAALAT